MIPPLSCPSCAAGDHGHLAEIFHEVFKCGCACYHGMTGTEAINSTGATFIIGSGREPYMVTACHGADAKEEK